MNELKISYNYELDNRTKTLIKHLISNGYASIINGKECYKVSIAELDFNGKMCIGGYYDTNNKTMVFNLK